MSNWLKQGPRGVVQEASKTAMVEQRIAVLIVEDELLVRMDIADSLEEAGFNVFEAANADEAIEILQQNDTIRALFTDVDMPGSMDGLKLAAHVRDRWPPIKIIVTSGHRQVAEETLPDPGRFLSKPYTPQSVIVSIRELVAQA
jgi:CheY-like chemotaxis protein